VTKVFDDYSAYVTEQQAKKVNGGQVEESAPSCTTLTLDDPNHYLTCKK